jgi:MarR family transcriptional regulator, lower aerobic nicotinate degradation pathway regulator
MSRTERSRSEKEEQIVRAMDSLRRLVRALGASSRTARGSGRISGAQLFALRQVAASPGIHIGDLARRTMARQSSVSELVARMVDRGLITRTVSEDDARQANLHLTKAGKRAISDSGDLAQEKLISGLEALPSSKRAALAEAMEAWLSASGLSDVPPTMFFELPESGRARGK